MLHNDGTLARQPLDMSPVGNPQNLKEDSRSSDLANFIGLYYIKCKMKLLEEKKEGSGVDVKYHSPTLCCLRHLLGLHSWCH